MVILLPCFPMIVDSFVCVLSYRGSFYSLIPVLPERAFDQGPENRVSVYRVRFFPVIARVDASILTKKISSVPESTKTGLSDGVICR